jgi:hypothetical protein
MYHSVSVKLKVHEAVKEEVYKDMVRVFHKYRGKIVHNSIIKLSVNGQRRYLAIRGLDEKEEDQIFLDWMSRNALGKLKIGQEYEFTIETTTLIEKLKWACRSSDPAGRIATWIAIWSAVLGIGGLVLGAYPIIQDLLSKASVEHVNSDMGPG